jgi:MFS family permease
MGIICFLTAAWSVSFGIGTQATSHWLARHGASDTIIGLVHSAYYLGVAAGSLFVPGWTRRFGLTTTTGGLVVSAVSLGMFPWAAGPAGWLSLRMLCGAGCAATLVPLETYLSRNCEPGRRAEAFSWFAVSLTLAGGLGIALGLEGFNPDGVLGGRLGGAEAAFWIGAAFPLIAAIVAGVRLGGTDAGTESSTPAESFRWRDHLLSFGAAWGQGFLEGGMLAFLSLFLVERGLSTTEAGTAMGAAMVGVIACQIPVGWIADRFGRRPSLLGCFAIAIVSALAIPLSGSGVFLAVGLFLFGASSGAMYPLGMALLDHRLPAGALARAYACYLAVECVGSQMGSALTGASRDVWGPGAMFPVCAAALLLALAVWGLGGSTRPTITIDADEPRRAA